MEAFAEACGIGRGECRAIIVDFQCHPLDMILGAHVDLTMLGGWCKTWSSTFCARLPRSP